MKFKQSPNFIYTIRVRLADMKTFFNKTIRQCIRCEGITVLPYIEIFVSQKINYLCFCHNCWNKISGYDFRNEKQCEIYDIHSNTFASILFVNHGFLKGMCFKAQDDFKEYVGKYWFNKIIKELEIK